MTWPKQRQGEEAIFRGGGSGELGWCGKVVLLIDQGGEKNSQSQD